MIVADTHVLIDALAGRDPAAARVTLELQSGMPATTAVSAFELGSGARSEHAREQVARLRAALPILPFDEAAAEAAARARSGLEAEGRPIGMADYLIAGSCLARSALLLTRNRSHFERIAGLRLATLHLDDR